VATVATTMQQGTAGADKRSTIAFRALVLFSLFYYARPEDVITPLRFVHISLISGIICIIGLIAGLSRRRKMKFPIAMTFLLLLFLQMIISIPFAIGWRMQAFEMVFSSFAKGVVVAVLICMLVDTLPQVRRLLFVQAAAVGFMALSSLGQHHTAAGRLIGAAGGIFENSNDLAINVAVNLPLCFAFFLLARGARKAAWGIPLAGMLAVVLLTYSRSGFLSLAMAGVVCLWEFAVKGRRYHLILLAVTALILMGAFAPAHYFTRLQSIYAGRIKGAADRGSEEGRKELFETSVQLMVQHPLLGVGPGNFPIVTGKWLVAHNTYSEMGAEVGIPALILFLLVLGAGINNLFVAQRSALFKKSLEFRVYTGGVMASMAAYMLGAVFADTAYNLFPYFLVAYTCALRQIAEHPEATLAAIAPLKPATPAILKKSAYAERATADLVHGPRR
jgi:O-antigen ligase